MSKRKNLWPVVIFLATITIILSQCAGGPQPVSRPVPAALAYADTGAVRPVDGFVRPSVGPMLTGAGAPGVPPLPSPVCLKNMVKYKDNPAFLISDEHWRDVLQLVSLTTWRDPSLSEQVVKYPTLIYHRENAEFDADAIIRFLVQYKPPQLYIFGGRPQGLKDLLVAPDPGAGMSLGQIKEKPMDSYLSFWSTIGAVVVCQDDYEPGLMASVLASYLNAPLFFDGHFEYELLDNKQAYVVGDVRPETTQYIADHCTPPIQKNEFTKDELLQVYAMATDTNRVILVNLDDISFGAQIPFTPEKSGQIQYIYGGHSLAAPYLAAAKLELIIGTKERNYLKIDDFLENTFASLPGECGYLTIMANPLVLPMARENRDTNPALWGNRVVFEEFDPDKIWSQPLSLRLVTVDPATGQKKIEQITGDQARPLSPAIYGDKVVWEDTRNGKPDIYMCDLSKGTETRITTNSEAQKDPAIYGDRIVWQDDRNGKWDIYMYDLITKTETRITTDPEDQQDPAIYGDQIVWEDHRNNNWDIYQYNIATNTETRITSNGASQCNPSIYGNTIVWDDCRNGAPDIYMSDPALSEVRITNDPHTQWFPSIDGDYIVWSDNRWGNWNVYLYNIITKTETRLTTSDNKQTRPIVQGDRVIWYSEGETGVPGKSVPPPQPPCGGRWLTYFYNIATGNPYVIHNNILTHEYSKFRQELDGRYYGSLCNYGQQDRAVGRIFGMTCADVSAYVARDLFLDKLPKNKDALLMVREDHQPETYATKADPTRPIDGPTLEAYARATFWTPAIRAAFDAEYFFSGYTSGPHPVDPNKLLIQDLYLISYLILYVDHGNYEGFVPVKSKNLLSRSLLPCVVLDTACATNTVLWGYLPQWNFWSTTDKWVTFSIENLRRGAMVYMGAVDNSYWHRMYDNIMIHCFLNGQTIGDAYKDARKEEYDSVSNLKEKVIWPYGDAFYALLGDPTFKPRWW